jgi:GNAT superfamily N-acetyltransferase
MHLRTLAPGEEERFLDLLDGWPFADERRGSELFRRYVELDPTFEPRNVWIAEVEGELASCLQIFPRVIRTTTGPLACGGIGSVFTRPQHRRTGIASDLLRRAIVAMEERRLSLSLLVASRLRWYQSLGWSVLRDTERWVTAPAAPRRDLRAMEPERDLDAVREIAAVYCADRVGVVVRDRVAWAASLRLAGDPDEEFLVAPAAGDVRAYLRVAELDGARRALAWGRTADGLEALVDLILSQAGSGLVLPAWFDDSLYVALRARDAKIEARQAPASWMVRGLGGSDPAALLPAARFAFWPADRF